MLVDSLGKCKKIIVAYFKLSQNLPGGTEEYHKKLVSIASTKTDGFSLNFIGGFS
jgi:hypothetical protein